MVVVCKNSTLSVERNLVVVVAPLCKLRSVVCTNPACLPWVRCCIYHMGGALVKDCPAFANFCG